MSNDLSVHAFSPLASMQTTARLEANTTNQQNNSAPEIKLPAKATIHYDAEAMRKNLQDAIARLNDQAQSKRQNLAFRIDEAANRFVITVKNTKSGEVIRQIPDEVVLKVAHNIEQLKGMLHNEVI